MHYGIGFPRSLGREAFSSVLAQERPPSDCYELLAGFVTAKVVGPNHPFLPQRHEDGEGAKPFSLFFLRVFKKLRAFVAILGLTFSALAVTLELNDSHFFDIAL